MTFETRKIGTAVDAIAPDGSEVRLLCSTLHGSMACFRLAPSAVSNAVAHRTVEEIWYFTAGRGRIWRKLGDRVEITEVAPGVSITIPTDAQFQFRCEGGEPLEAVAITMPPWPGADEAYSIPGIWEPTVSANGALFRIAEPPGKAYNPAMTAAEDRRK
jgi:mannose-6-phosphate isomerase-like protein (cupin superfamily)